MDGLIDASIIPEIINVALLALLIVTAVAVIYVRNLLTAAMLLGIYSLIMAGCWTILDAVDVAFTEAAVGAGITTVLFLASIALVGREERGRAYGPLVPLIVTVGTGAALIYATVDMPFLASPMRPCTSMSHPAISPIPKPRPACPTS